jgi:hypothetical protein
VHSHNDFFCCRVFKTGDERSKGVHIRKADGSALGIVTSMPCLPCIQLQNSASSASCLAVHRGREFALFVWRDCHKKALQDIFSVSYAICVWLISLFFVTHLADNSS